MTPPTLDEATLLTGVRILSERDADLRRIIEAYGPPPLWAREPSFATLVHIILEQQVSLASANAAFARLKTAANPLTPAAFLELDDEALRGIGFSRQKMGYGRDLARALLAGELNLAELEGLSDEDARAELVKIKGIGKWTANIYLMEVLLRPDIWPGGDLALLNAIGKVKKLTKRPSADEFQKLGEPWRPWRAVAARMLWHHYLSG